MCFLCVCARIKVMEENIEKRTKKWGRILCVSKENEVGILWKKQYMGTHRYP